MSEMNSFSQILIGLVWFVFSVGQPPSSFARQEAHNEHVVNLFDRKSLDGFDADPKYWSVENGVIIGQIPQGQTLDHNTWLVYQDRQFSDFDLRFQFQISGLPAANSGVQFRSQVDSIRHVSGYQADMDMGKTWLGRIYDEHGRALIVERGTRVEIDAEGKRTVRVLAPAAQYEVLFRENGWNDYRIVAIGHRIAIWINGTLFCELMDHQKGEFDLDGFLAWQLHSGPETLLKFRDLRVEVLSADDKRLGPWVMNPAPDKKEDAEPDKEDNNSKGIVPSDDSGQPLNLGFELGNLKHWTVTGDAFKDQPIANDGITQRWPDQQSNKEGSYFIGGYEVVRDQGVGTLTSDFFQITNPFASFLIGGGRNRSTRVEIHLIDAAGEPQVIYTASGEDREAMRRVVVDLQQYQNQQIRIQLIDENRGGWGHLNFDDFRFHEAQPKLDPAASAWRTTANPILQHLVPNPQRPVTHDESAAGTLKQMFVPEGFSVDIVAAEPRLHQPMAFTFDGQGRLWVVEGHCYPERRPEGQGLDRILIFSDEDGDGHFETRRVFIEGLNLVSALEVGYGGVWVGAAPELLFIPDLNGDDVPDGAPVVLLDGFGFADTHETLNNFCWGPDGWLYGNQGVFNLSRIGRPGSAEKDREEMAAGVFRYHPTRHVFEVFAHGGSNQWGLDFDEHGQCFMTHCRSYWGGGPTTHVMPGGHYWNQLNTGYADFISAQGIDVQPALKNYLMASARYGHGEGGAGKPGTNVVYGGHSHVGTMLYLGDNWPAEYRNRLFTHNLHGHQMNQQINLRGHGGYNTVHAGQDLFFCADPQYIGVDLKYGPDGAVYISDWYDPRHCHSPNIEQWDRGNGRIYRMQFDATYRPVAVNLREATDVELVELQDHVNEWYVRMARLELVFRASQRSLDERVFAQLRTWLRSSDAPLLRLRSLWCLNAIGKFDESIERLSLSDKSEYVRSWGVRLAVDQRPDDSNRWTNERWERFAQMVEQDSSWLVKRELASAAQRLPTDRAWTLVERLAMQPEIEQDRALVSLLWFATAKLIKVSPLLGIELSKKTNVTSLRDFILWYVSKNSDTGREYVIEQMTKADDDEQYRLLRILEHGLQGLRGLPMPDSWQEVSLGLYDSANPRIQRASEAIGAVFRDPELFARSRAILQTPDSSEQVIIPALNILSQDTAGNNLSLLTPLLDRPALVGKVLPLLGRYDDLLIAQSLIERLAKWDTGTLASSLELLTSRVSWAAALLDAVERGDIPNNLLTAYHVRRMVDLDDRTLSQRLEASWGKAGGSSQELQEQIAKIVRMYETAPLWAYEASAGKQHFQQLCANCHQDTNQDSPIAPLLGGSGAKGIVYMVENVIDPNAVVGRDYQARLILTIEGRVVTGLVIQESPTAITIRTATETETIPRDEIEEIKVSDKSFMPEGLLQSLEERQIIELLKYLMSL